MINEFREKYPEFIYEDFIVEETDDDYIVEYHFSISELSFNPKLIINKKQVTNTDIDKEYLNYLFFQYGLFDSISYYKLTCSPKFIIKPMFIDENQIMFFKKLFFNGLGEYFYINNFDVNLEDFVEFEVLSNNKYQPKPLQGNFTGNLIPVGGGKDSIVSMELLKDYKDDNKLFMLERNIYPKNKAGYESIYMSGYKDRDITIIENHLDLKLIDLVKQGYLNGHIPISANISMTSYIMAYLTNRKYIVLSNEDSANEGNIKGTTINHQYSKSYEYEKDFQNYSNNYLSKEIYYFSLLRPWNEYRIIKEFVKHKQYLNIFRSCNRGTKTNSWCNHCSKCLYVYIMLYPHLTAEELNLVFDSNMLDDETLEKDFLGLILEDVNKPFECVGERKEINYSLALALKNKGENLPYLLNLYKEKYNIPDINASEIEEYFNNINSVPEEYIKYLR